MSVHDSIANAMSALTALAGNEELLRSIDRISEVVVETYAKGGKLLVAGNGGSHADALHFCEELTGRFRGDRKPLAAIALGEATHMSCVSNDFGFDQVFSRMVNALAKPEDTLIVLSTSGNSQNLINAVIAGQYPSDVYTVGLLGKGGGKLQKLVDLPIVFPGETSDRIQELHMMTLHIIVEEVERKLFPQLYT